MTTYTDENAEARAEFIASLAIDYSATFIPQSVSRNRDEKNKSLNWRVKLSRNGVSIETDYMQGIGHVPGYRHSLPHTLYFEQIRKDIDAASETGRYPHEPFRVHKHEHGERLDVVSHLVKPLPAPSLEEVLYSLTMDASAWRMTFDEWASEYGYDTDSRKAEASYRACADIGLRLVRMLGGHETFEKLETLFGGF